MPKSWAGQLQPLTDQLVQERMRLFLHCTKGGARVRCLRDGIEMIVILNMEEEDEERDKAKWIRVISV